MPEPEAFCYSVGEKSGLSRPDGGGTAVAAVNPIFGADNVARFFAGLARKAPPNLGWRIEDSGGVPSLLLLEGETAVSLITLDFMKTDGSRGCWCSGIPISYGGRAEWLDTGGGLG